jgi:glycosyltransferase involved in cell wall biosynthesis
VNNLDNKKIELSIIIAAWNGDSMLSECLGSLNNQTEKNNAEIIVVSNFQTVPTENDFSIPVKFIEKSANATVPQLRTEGIINASGKIIALVEDHCVFDSLWCQEIKKAYESGFSIVGGTVENARSKKALDWAVYFYDYGKYMLPNREGEGQTLSGLNISYKRETLEEVREFYRDGFFETFVNEQLKKRGHHLIMMPTAIVYHKKNYEIKRAFEHSFYLARSFAARRVAGFGILKRICFSIIPIILPLLLMTRIITTTVIKGRYLRKLFRSVPFLILLISIWSFGEFCGYLFGEGNSADKWR